MDASATYTWFEGAGSNPTARVRLFCFPHAAAANTVYSHWAGGLPDWCEVVTIQTPSHLSLVGQAVTSMATYMEDLVRLLDPLLDRPYAIFGHSFGAVAAYALAATLQKEQPSLAPPLRVVVSGEMPPGSPFRQTMPDGWNDPEHTDVLRKEALSWDGVTPEVLAEPEAWSMLASMLRADLQVSESAAYAIADSDAAEGHTQLRCPLTAVAGDADDVVVGRGPGLDAWKDIAADASVVREVAGVVDERPPFDAHYFPGRHFYHVPPTTTGTKAPGGDSPTATSSVAIAAATAAASGAVRDSAGEVATAADSAAGFNGLMSLLREHLSVDLALSDKRAAAQLQSWQSGRMAYPHDKLLHELFVEQARRTPDEPAVVDPANGVTLSYREVDEVTDALAVHLYHCGVGPDVPVGIFFERSAEYMLAYISALKAGGAYMPLEVAYPKDLLTRVCATVEPAVVFTKPAYTDRLPAAQKVWVFDAGWRDRLAALSHPPPPPSRPMPTIDNLAYVVMSSGTTGEPKGICCPHRGAVYSYNWRFQNLPYRDGDEREACNVFFVWECLRPLLRGVPLYIIPDSTIFDPDALLHFLHANRITRVLFTPSLAQLLVDSVETSRLRSLLSTLRALLLCGEVVAMELRDRLVAVLPEDCAISNLYSISECHDVSNGDLRVVDRGSSRKFAHAGKVMANVRCYVVDDELRLQPVGLPGEVYVAGPTLARGYLKLPEKTAERFPPNPFAESETPVPDAPPGTALTDPRMYRTGDRGRFLPGGTLELVGRCDFMVKIRGYSVVLGAVETALAAHPDISSAVVLAVGAETEDKRLVAYVVPEEWDRPHPSASVLQTFLRNKLPHYAIPPTVIVLDALPVHPVSGKLDRRRLPTSAPAAAGAASASVSAAEPDSKGVAEGGAAVSGGAAGAASAPTVATGAGAAGGSAEANLPRCVSAATEKRMLALWTQLLHCDEEAIAPSSAFFSVGGHSLLAARLTAKIKSEFEVAMPVALVIELSTLRAVSNFVAVEGAESKSRRSRSDSLIDADVEISPVDDTVLDPTITRSEARKPAVGYSRFRLSSARFAPSRVLLTGATGYLGAFILADLMRRTHTVVYCLVRAKDSDDGFERIARNLVRYGLWDTVCEAVGGRLVAVVGDLSKPGLGLSQMRLRALAGECDAIIHNGALVNLVAPYASLRHANVLGTHEVLRLTSYQGYFGTRPKTVCYVSSNGVFPQGRAEVREDDVMKDVGELEDGYGQSKWASEELCRKARDSGVPVAIMRPGNMGPATTGVWNSNDFVYLLVAASIEMGAVPRGAPWHFDLTPVDFAATGIVDLFVRSPSGSLGRTVHVQSPHAAVAADDVFGWVVDALETEAKAAGAAAAPSGDAPRKCEWVPLAEWRRRLEVAADASTSGAAGAAAGGALSTPLPAAAAGASNVLKLVAGIDSFEKYLVKPPVFHSDAFHAELADMASEAKCPPMSRELIGRAVAHMLHPFATDDGEPIAPGPSATPPRTSPVLLS